MEPKFQSAVFLDFSLCRRNDVFFIPERSLPYIDLTYCLAGTMEYCYEEKKVVLHAGDAILYPSGSVRQRSYTNTPNYYASFNIQFKEPFEPLVSGLLQNCVRSDTAYMLETFNKVYASVAPYKQEKCAAIFSYLYYQLIEATMEKENVHVKKVKQYIISHLSEPLSLENLAKMVHLAPQYLSYLFKKHAGITLKKYIIEQRIDFAKRLIVAQDIPLYQVAERSGFNDYNAFSLCFKKTTGTTASQYRKIKLKNF